MSPHIKGPHLWPLILGPSWIITTILSAPARKAIILISSQGKHLLNVPPMCVQASWPLLQSPVWGPQDQATSMQLKIPTRDVIGAQKVLDLQPQGLRRPTSGQPQRRPDQQRKYIRLRTELKAARLRAVVYENITTLLSRDWEKRDNTQKCR